MLIRTYCNQCLSLLPGFMVYCTLAWTPKPASREFHGRLSIFAAVPAAKRAIRGLAADF